MTPGAAAKKAVCNGLELLIENIHGELGTHTIVAWILPTYKRCF